MENEKTILTFEHNGIKATYELPWDSGMEEMLDTFFSACISMTFMPDTILKNMKLYAEEKLKVYGWDEED